MLERWRLPRHHGAVIRRYLDFNATTPLCARARSAIAAELDRYGNPSSLHREGQQARQRLETARRQVAAALDADPFDVIFTSGGTESNQLALRLASGAKDRAIVVSATAHPSLVGAVGPRQGPNAAKVSILGVDGRGALDLDQLLDQLRTGGVGLVAVEWVNHETGVVQDVAAVAKMVHAAGARLHLDAVQALGKLPVSVEIAGADSVALSSHKIYGPTGVGALWLRPEARTPWPSAGAQERGRRAGTESTVSIAGFGAAASRIEECLRDGPRQGTLRDQFEGAASSLGATIVGGDGTRIHNTSLVRFPGVPAEVLVAALDVAGFAVSAGAACASGRIEPSPVALAMGLSEHEARETFRVSLGESSTADDIAEILGSLGEVVPRVRRFAE